jgi:hypothetical protein
LEAPGLRNIAIGVAERTNDERLVFRSWPLFSNFDRNIVPAFLLRVKNQDRMPIWDVAGEDDWKRLGPDVNTVAAEVDAGTEMTPASTKMSIELEIERGSSRHRGDLLFVVRLKSKE